MSKRQSAYHFFLKHAGYSYSQNETTIQGRRRCAKALAHAERYAREHDWEAEWIYEPENPRDVLGEPDPINGPFYDPNSEFVACLLYAPNTCECGRKRRVIASLSMIEAPTREYRRVVEAELALEAMPTIELMEEE